MPSPGGACIVIQGSTFQSLGMGAEYEGTLELNARKKPKHFDLLFNKGPEAGNPALGIYELNGEDWKLCLTLTGSARPEKFAAAPGSGHALETLRRGPAKPVREPAPEEPGEPVVELEGEWQMVACIFDGDSLPDSMLKTGRRAARGNESSTWFGEGLIMQARYTVDRDAMPHAIDYTLRDGTVQFGIWKLEGEVLHVCFAPPGKPRPADFTSPRGNGHTYTAWKRTGA